MLNKFYFNGHWSDEFGIRIESPVQLNRPARKFQSASVMGRNGNIYQMQDAYDEVIVSYKIFAGSSAMGSNVSSFTNIMEWLHSSNGYTILKDTYDSTHYRQAVFLDAVEVENVRTMWGKATINFRCRPERYIISEPVTVPSGSVVNNTTNHIAKPIITLTGAGVTSLFKMTGRTQGSADAVGSHQLYSFIPNMDTRIWLVRRDSPNTNVAVFFISGTSYGGSVTSLTEGALEYEINGNTYNGNWGVGFIINAQPDTDYTLSWETYDSGRVEVWYANKTGYNNISGSVFKETASGDWVADYLKFHTPQECGYLLISLGHIGVNTPAKTSQKYRNVMLNTGTEVQPFRAFTTPIVSTFKINNTTLHLFSTGFKTVNVDCERENVSIDGADNNQNITLLDQYGNISEKFLQLDTGNNTVRYVGDITTCSMDTKFWNL